MDLHATIGRRQIPAWYSETSLSNAVRDALRRSFDERRVWHQPGLFGNNTPEPSHLVEFRLGIHFSCYCFSCASTIEAAIYFGL